MLRRFFVFGTELGNVFPFIWNEAVLLPLLLTDGLRHVCPAADGQGLLGVQCKIEIPLPGADALAQPAQAYGFTHGKVRGQGYFNRFKLSLNSLAYLQAHPAARRKVCGGQGKALLFVDLSAQPAPDQAGDAFCHVR